MWRNQREPAASRAASNGTSKVGRGLIDSKLRILESVPHVAHCFVYKHTGRIDPVEIPTDQS